MKSKINALINGIGDWLFPPKCPFCTAVGDTDEICHQCKNTLPWESQPTFTLGKLSCAASLSYENLVRESIHRFKFQGCRYLAKPFGQLMAQTAVAAYPDGFDVVTWAPVSKKRLRHRGYDQSHLLAQEMCKLWDTTPQRLIHKHTHTVAQSRLNDTAARRGNVIGVYEAADTSAVAGKRVLLVDDIATTGATLQECARVLELAGAREVLCVVFAKTQKK